MYKFRLTISHSVPGFFSLDCSSFGFLISQNLGVEIYPRDAKDLCGAKNYHVDCGGFETEDQALLAGEELRKRLRFLNSVFDLGLMIPVSDSVTGRVSNSIKEKAAERGGVVLDGRKGLSVIPDDGKHFEVFMSGEIRVTPGDPFFLFDAVKKIWRLGLDFDDEAEGVIELLNISSVEKSSKLKFLTAYLALEQLIPVSERSERAKNLISRFISETNSAGIPDDERASLVGSLSNLKRGSFSSALKRFAKRIDSPCEIQGYSPEKLASVAIELRNKIAHKVDVPESVDMDAITKGVREMALAILGHKYEMPSFSVFRPADAINADKFELRVL